MVEQLAITRDLGLMRRQIDASDAVATLSAERRRDFVLAVNEAATNALEYGEPPQSVRLWRDAEEVVGEVSNGGVIEDPVMGCDRPSPTASRGRGLWIINQLCDVVELRSSRSRTTLRLHMRCEQASRARRLAGPATG